MRIIQCEDKLIEEEKKSKETIGRLQQLEKDESQQNKELTELDGLVTSLYNEQEIIAVDIDEFISRCHKLELEIADKEESLQRNPSDMVSTTSLMFVSLMRYFNSCFATLFQQDAAKTELADVNQEILIQSQQLQDVTLAFDGASNNEYRLNTE